MNGEDVDGQEEKAQVPPAVGNLDISWKGAASAGGGSWQLLLGAVGLAKAG